MNYPKFYIGPMSKNIVDAIIEFSNDNNVPIGLIPSRRQIEYLGGYVNNWTTDDFIKYIHSQSSKNIILQRDHAGPGQGSAYDDGYESLKYDCKGFNLIHIDPWKDNPSYLDGLQETMKMIDYCYKLNPHILYEIGTEEAIRKFEVAELEDLIIDLQYGLGQEIYDKIKYLVIQSGTSLKGTKQTGTYNPDRLKDMILLCRKYGLLSKEHNGDYLQFQVIKDKFILGLDAINIAPEFGVIETEFWLEEVKGGNGALMTLFYKLCYDSHKWEKWVDKDFKPEENKKELIRICGHYMFSHPSFTRLHNPWGPKFKDNSITNIKKAIKVKLKELYEL